MITSFQLKIYNVHQLQCASSSRARVVYKPWVTVQSSADQHSICRSILLCLMTYQLQAVLTADSAYWWNYCLQAAIDGSWRWPEATDSCKQFPMVSDLAVRYLSVPGNSADTEVCR